MKMVCPQCNDSFENKLVCPQCRVKLIYPSGGPPNLEALARFARSDIFPTIPRGSEPSRSDPETGMPFWRWLLLGLAVVGIVALGALAAWLKFGKQW
jgi:hypothetical protein